MDIRFVTKQVHAYLDYPVAATLMVAPLRSWSRRIHPNGEMAVGWNRCGSFVADGVDGSQIGSLARIAFWVPFSC